MGNPGLKTYYDADEGFKQFADRHEKEAGKSITRRECEPWLNEQRLWVIEYARGKAEDEARGMAKGRAETYLEAALKAFQRARPGEDLSVIAQSLSILDIPPGIIQYAREQVESKRSRRRKRSQAEGFVADPFESSLSLRNSLERAFQCQRALCAKRGASFSLRTAWPRRPLVSLDQKLQEEVFGPPPAAGGKGPGGPWLFFDQKLALNMPRALPTVGVKNRGRPRKLQRCRGGSDAALGRPPVDGGSGPVGPLRLVKNFNFICERKHQSAHMGWVG